MIYFLKGKIFELAPTHVVIEVNNVGYYVAVSLLTSKELSVGREALLYTQQIFREDAQLLFGFHTLSEKEFFNLLISVNGVGPVSALIMLSSLEIQEIATAILSGNSAVLRRAKGIGTKTADRIIVDLRDKVQKFAAENADISMLMDNKIKNEALTAVEVLGIPKRVGEKIATKILKDSPDIDVETLVKQILKNI